MRAYARNQVHIIAHDDENQESRGKWKNPTGDPLVQNVFHEGFPALDDQFHEVLHSGRDFLDVLPRGNADHDQNDGRNDPGANDGVGDGKWPDMKEHRRRLRGQSFLLRRRGSSLVSGCRLEHRSLGRRLCRRLRIQAHRTQDGKERADKNDFTDLFHLIITSEDTDGR